MRRRARTTATAMLVLSALIAATALVGCRVTGADSAGSPKWVSGKPMPSGFSGARAWTANVTWPRSGLFQSGVPAIQARGTQYPPPVAPGLVAVAGDVVVVAAFAASKGPAPEVVTLQFRNAKTGEVVASKGFDVWAFAWIRADTVDGKPVVEVRYSPKPTATDGSTFVNTVFDTSGHQVWTSAGQNVVSFLQTHLEVVNSGGLMSHGYLLRVNPGSDSHHRDGRYDVLDLTGKVVVSVPYLWCYNERTALTLYNTVRLIDGYLVVTNGDGPCTIPPAPTTSIARFTVYDLAQGGKKVADPTEPIPVVVENVHVAAQAVASCGSKLVLFWATGSYRPPNDIAIRFAVLDTRSGQTTTPVSTPAPLRSDPPVLNWVADPTCSTILFHGRIPGPATLAIGLAQGNLLWRKDFNDQYLSMRGGVIYAMRPPDPPGPAPGQLLSIAAANGGTVGGDLGAAPLAFTADGSPVFAELSDPAVCDPPPAPPTAPPAVRSPGPSPSPRASAPVAWPTLPESCGVTVWVGRTSR